jgi:large subunit ribosomal protein L5
MKEKNFYQHFKEVVVPALKAELGYTNNLQVPKITKVVINVGVGRFIKEAHYIENVVKTLERITGQKPMRTVAKKSISNFKIREGMDIGVMVTLRGPRMYDFLEKFLKVTLPRVRDFHGVSPKSFDNQGNYAMGFKENISFPEVKVDELDKVHGLQIIITTTAKNKDEGMKLLKQIGFPFAKK